MISSHIENLIVKWFTKSATAVDLDELSEWIKVPENNQIFIDYVETHYAITFSTNNPDATQIKERLLQEIRKETSVFYKFKLNSILKYAAVAILFLSVGYFYQNDYISNSSNISNSDDDLIKSVIEPGTDKATLTLEDGSVVALEKDKVYQSDKVNSDGKQLVYAVNNKPKKELVYNYLTIPRGGQFYVKLSDGTEVWLNSESQLKYPVAFIGGVTREVELVYGEAYFDISHSANHNGDKFKVLNQNQEVEVFGTEFNIKAYKGENNTYTTLIQGKVTISNSISKQDLVPNQQVKIDLNNNKMTVNTVDVYREISWKKGLFSFKSMPLKEIMVVLSRWYDVNIVFDNAELEGVKFNGVISKNEKIEEILTIIKNTNFINAYEITDKKITIK